MFHGRICVQINSIVRLIFVLEQYRPFRIAIHSQCPFRDYANTTGVGFVGETKWLGFWYYRNVHLVGCATTRIDFKAKLWTWWHGSVFHTTGPLWGESTRHRWILFTKSWWFGALMFPLLSDWANKQSICRWFQTSWRSCDITAIIIDAIIRLRVITLWAVCDFNMPSERMS